MAVQVGQKALHEVGEFVEISVCVCACVIRVGNDEAGSICLQTKMESFESDLKTIKEVHLFITSHSVKLWIF